MMKLDYSNGAEKGRVLARGRGAYKMMDVCYRNGWSDDNTILVVNNGDSLESSWTIYEKR